MEMLDTVLFVLSLSLKIFTLYFAAVAVFALRRRKRFPRSAPQTRFAVVVAARNEEAVIGNLVCSVLSQEYPEALRDVFVVPNNCTDFTEAAAAAAGAEIIHCLGPVSSKGDALHQAFAQLLPKGYDALLVFDADNVLAPDYLSRMNDAFASGAQVCKSRTRAQNPTASGVAGCYGLYNVIFDLIWNRARAACGLSAKLVGTGFGFRREVLEHLGGWNTSTIAEDAEFAAQCAGAGYRVCWVPDALNYDEEPNSFRLSLRQRKRWCSGVMQVAKQEVGRLWRTPARAPLGYHHVPAGALYTGGFRPAAPAGHPGGRPDGRRHRSCRRPVQPGALLRRRDGAGGAPMPSGGLRPAGHDKDDCAVPCVHGVVAAPPGDLPVPGYEAVVRGGAQWAGGPHSPLRPCRI